MSDDVLGLRRSRSKFEQVPGFRVADAARLAQMSVPEHETVIEFPARMMQFFPEVKKGGVGDDVR